MRPETGCRLQTPWFRLETTGFRLQTTWFRLQTVVVVLCSLTSTVSTALTHHCQTTQSTLPWISLTSITPVRAKFALAKQTVPAEVELKTRSFSPGTTTDDTFLYCEPSDYTHDTLLDCSTTKTKMLTSKACRSDDDEVEMVYCSASASGSTTQSVIGVMYSVLQPALLDANQNGKAVLLYVHVDGQDVKDNGWLCPFKAYESPQTLPGSQCRAEYTATGKKVAVTCGSCHVMPGLQCTVNAQNSRTTLRENKNIITCAASRNDDLEQVHWARSPIACTGNIDLSYFQSESNGLEAPVNWKAHINNSPLPPTQLTVTAAITLPTPMFFPSCIDEANYKKSGSHRLGPCTCYIRKHLTEHQSPLRLTGLPDPHFTVQWYKDGLLVTKQTDQLDTSLPEVKLLQDDVMISTTIQIEVKDDAPRYECRGSGDITKQKAKVIDAKFTKKIFVPPYLQRRSLLLADNCNKTIFTGDMAVCTCYNTGANINNKFDLYWKFCKGDNNCGKDMPKNMRVVSRLFATSVFIHPENADDDGDKYLLKCVQEEGDESYSLDYTVTVTGDDMTLSTPAGVAYAMIGACLIGVLILILIIKKLVRWYWKVDQMPMSEMEDEGEVEDGEEDEEDVLEDDGLLDTQSSHSGRPLVQSNVNLGTSRKSYYMI